MQTPSTSYLHFSLFCGINQVETESWFYDDRFGSSNHVEEYNVTTAYRLALETWASWIDSTINPQTQTVFFMSMSPTHLW